MKTEKVPAPKSFARPQSRREAGTGRRHRSAWLPQQHGAWAMVFAPLLLGAVISGLTYLHLLLIPGAASAYAAFELGSAWARTRGKYRDNYRLPFLSYVSCAAFCAIALLFLRPDLLLYVLLLPIALIVLWLSSQRQERSLPARVLQVFLGLALAPVSYQLGSAAVFPWPHPQFWIRTIILGLYLWGTIPHVKALLRKRRSRAWFLGSLFYHLLTATFVTFATLRFTLNPAVTVLFWLSVGRAAAYPLYSRRLQKPIKPLVIGITEILLSVLLTAALML